MVMMVVFPPTKRVAVQLMKTDLFDCMGIRSAVVTVAVQLKSRAAQEVFLFAGPRLWAYFTESEEMPCRMVYGTQIAIVCYSYSGESKPTNITGGPHIVELLAFAKMFSDPMLFRITGPKKKNRADAIQGRCATRLPLFFPLHAFSPEPSSVLSCRADAKTGELNWLRSRSVFDWDWESDKQIQIIYLYIYIYLLLYIWYVMICAKSL